MLHSKYEKDHISHPKILNDMCYNVFRNAMIIEDIKNSEKNRKIPVVLTERVEHLYIIKQGLEDLNVPVVIYKGRIIQYVGRLHREHEGKEKVVVYDYVDNMGVLKRMYGKRLSGYRMAGYDVME